MKMTAGERVLACLKRSRTREAPTPMNISTNSDAFTERNATPGDGWEGNYQIN